MSPIPIHNTTVNIEEITGSRTSKGKWLTHSHQRTGTALYHPAPPRQLMLQEVSRQLAATSRASSEGCAMVLTSPNPAWQPLISKLLEAIGSWINAQKHHPEEIRREILQSRRLLSEKWHR